MKINNLFFCIVGVFIGAMVSVLTGSSLEAATVTGVIMITGLMLGFLFSNSSDENTNQETNS